MLILPLLLAIVLILWSVRFVLSCCLKLKYKNLYGGFLSGGDAVWGVEDASRSIINILLIVQNENETREEFMKSLKQTIYEGFNRYINEFPKIASVRCNTMGYTYLVKNQINVLDCVRFIIIDTPGEYILRHELNELVGSYSNKLLPLQGNALWEVIIFSKPIEWSNTNKKRAYPVLCRFNHIIGDGLSLTTVLFLIFCNELSALSKFKHTLGKVLPKENKRRKFNAILHFIHITLTAPSVVFRQIYLRKSNPNILNGPELIGEKILAFSVEENEILVPAIKKIKKVLRNASFSDIILTAISCSLLNYFQKVSLFLNLLIRLL